MELTIASDGKRAKLRVEPLSDPSCREIVVHTGSWTGGAGRKEIRLDPGKPNELNVPIRL